MHMDNFSLLLKPVGGACNLDCEYCFYKGHTAGTIPEELLAHILESYCRLPLARHSIALQGGEPLLAPSYVFDMIEASPLDDISLQTNATLITEELAERFARSGWLVGVSLDGDETHCAARGSSYARAVEGIRCLEKYGAEYNILCTVTKKNVYDLAAVYRFLRDNFATRSHQYIECTSSELAISSDEWGKALVSLFDEWFAHDVETLSIRLFDSIANELLRGMPTQCTFSNHCRHYLAVEHDGGVYPCDFYVDDAHILGNIKSASWHDLLECARRVEFSNIKSAISTKCAACQYLRFCRGDCPRNRQNSSGASRLCEGYRRFFSHALPLLMKYCSCP